MPGLPTTSASRSSRVAGDCADGEHRWTPVGSGGTLEHMSEQTAPHEARQVAESFGIDARRYDRARPPYPQELIDQVVAASPGPEALDVGSGTGIAARQLQAAGCTVLGVEPDERMAAFARDRGTDVEVAKFEEWEPKGRQFDAIVAAQSWHWVEPDAGVAKGADVLRNNGRLALFGHVFEPPEPVAAAGAQAFERLVPDSPFSAAPSRRPVELYQQMYLGFADRISANSAFDQPEHWRFDWRRTYTREQWLDFMPTTGGMTHLPEDIAEQVLDVVGAAIDAIGGQFEMEYTTLAVTARRK